VELEQKCVPNIILGGFVALLPSVGPFVTKDVSKDGENENFLKGF